MIAMRPMEIKTNTMTQGEVLSSFAPIFAFIQICEDRQKRKDEIMSINDVNIMMPFVTKAQKAVDKISCYALNNINSKEKGKIEIMNLIKHNFVILNNQISFDTFKGYDSNIDMLNNSIISVLYQINNTYDCLSTLEESLYTPVPNVEKNSTTDEKKSETTTALEQRIKELESEIETLRKENEELKEIKSMMDTPLDDIEADSKVGLTVILKLMEKDGANFEKSKNKTTAMKALKMMTGRSESACKQIFSVPLSLAYHKRKINEMNDYLNALGMETQL